MTEITEAERTALRHPMVSHGARIEAEFRARAQAATGHADLIEYVEALAEVRGCEVSSAELAAMAAWVFSAGSPRLRCRLRLAWRVLFGASW